MVMASRRPASNMRRIGAVRAAALSGVSILVLAAIAIAVAAAEDRVCSIAPDGREECESETVVVRDYHDRDRGPPPPPDDDDDDDDDDDGSDEFDYDSDYGEDDEEGEGCVDRHDECESLAESGECEKNPGFMKYECAASCGTCPEFVAAYRALGEGMGAGPCSDEHPECAGWAAMGECGFNPNFMLTQCERSCVMCFEDTNQFGVHQELPPEDDEYYAETKEVIEKSIEYMKGIWVHTDDNNRINYKCRNMDKDCSLWAVDQCDGDGDSDDDDDDYAEWIQANCAPACQTCHLLDTQLRCPIEEGNELVFGSGGLNELFERIAYDSDGRGEYLKYSPKVLSRPRSKADGTAAPPVDEGGNDDDGPWIVLLENFISDGEADALIAAGHEKGYERSSDVGVENPDGTHEEEVSDGRTSHNSWCDEELCERDPVIGPVIRRIAWATGTTVNNHEHLQLLQYEPGQYYNQHHDYIEYQQGLPCGVRMLTLFLYLNDVEEGGGTRFPLLDVTVQPRKGGALLWPSVMDRDPEEKDFRTDHEALPVIKGIKYGANAWIHTRGYREAEANDCA